MLTMMIMMMVVVVMVMRRRRITMVTLMVRSWCFARLGALRVHPRRLASGGV